MMTGERLGYATAVLVLIVGGALIKTPILNWLSGPAIVVASVWFWVWVTDRETAQ